MNNKSAIYDSGSSKELSVNRSSEIFNDKEVIRIFYKLLSPNDNSKNQPYMGGHLTDLGFIPTGTVTEITSASGKTKDPKRKIFG